MPNWTREIGVLAGLALIGYAIFAYDHSTLFPGLSAIWPCLGTALVILSTGARYAAAPLCTAPAVWLGKISYSLYLVHWPDVVFFIMEVQPEPTVAGKWLMVVLAILLGAAQHRHVEARYRHGGAGKDLRFAGLAALCAAPILTSAAVAVVGGGMAWRVPADRLVMSDAETRALVRDTYCGNAAPAGTFAGDHASLVTCQNHRRKGNSILVWGDSHALHLAPGFARHYQAFNVHVLYRNGCVPQSGFAKYVRKLGAQTQACVDRNLAIVAALTASEPTNAIMTSAKRSRTPQIARATASVLAKLRAAGHNVVLLGDVIRPGRDLAMCRSAPAYIVSDDELEHRCQGNRAEADRELLYNRSLGRKIPDMVRVADFQCPQGKCKFYDRGKLMFRDSHHLNVEGSQWFVRQLKSRLPIYKATRPGGSLDRGTGVHLARAE